MISNRRFLSSIIMLIVLFPIVRLSALEAQTKRRLVGELNIVDDDGGSTAISVEAIGNLWGRRQDGFPLIDSLRSLEGTDLLQVRFIDREEDLTPPLFGYGKYRITINGHSEYTALTGEVDFFSTKFLKA